MFNDNITIFGNIMVTENYDMFKKIGGNRKINKANYAKIVKSMKEEQLIIPIVVNERYEIIDGQHRYTACRWTYHPDAPDHHVACSTSSHQYSRSVRVPTQSNSRQ